VQSRYPVIAAFAAFAVILACSKSSSASSASTSAASAGPDSLMLRRADHARILGSTTAPVWVVEVSDFQCPYCRQFHDESYAELKHAYVDSGKVRLAYVNFPLSMHHNAFAASETAMCAAAQDKFWQMHDALFITQKQWEALPAPQPMFDSLAAAQGVDLAAAAAIVGSRVVSELSQQAGRAQELGSYRLVAQIGHGGMGEVWRAEHRMLARDAAIKLVRPGTDASGRELMARFEREAKATAGLRSPHTVQLYDFGRSDDGAFYYVMELLEGFTLEEIVRRFGPLPAGRVVHLLRQVCHSLAEAHAAGLVHRDIKPGNIFVCRYGGDPDFVKVLDFGLVKTLAASAADLTQTGFLAGTPAYMPPEMALGRPVDGRTDLYALGAVGYTLLTGLPVFERKTALETIHDHASTVPVPPSKRIAVPVPPDLERVLLDCLAKEPDERPGSARALDGRLAEIVLPEPWTRDLAERWWNRNGTAAIPAPATAPDSTSDPDGTSITPAAAAG